MHNATVTSYTRQTSSLIALIGCRCGAAIVIIVRSLITIERFTTLLREIHYWLPFVFMFNLLRSHTTHRSCHRRRRRRRQKGIVIGPRNNTSKTKPFHPYSRYAQKHNQCKKSTCARSRTYKQTTIF